MISQSIILFSLWKFRYSLNYAEDLHISFTNKCVIHIFYDSKSRLSNIETLMNSNHRTKMISTRTFILTV